MICRLESALCCLLMLAIVFATKAAWAEDLIGRVTDVTLYRGQAMVTRAVDIKGGAEVSEVVVAGLPEQIDPTSLFAEGSEGVEVRAVRYRTRAIGEEPREEVRKLDEELEALQEQIHQNSKSLEVLLKRIAYLDQLEGFVAPTAKTELSKGVLDAEALQTITTFSFAQRDAIAKEQLDLGKIAKDLNKQVSLVQRKRNELTQGTSKIVREAVLFLRKASDADELIRLNYLVTGCGWSPAYTIRAGADRKQVAVECSGLIQQMTGEDWNDVNLTLSTASPALSAAGPGLAPFPVTLTEGPQDKLNQQDLATRLSKIQQSKTSGIVANRNALNLRDNIGSSWTVNSAANEFQCLELINGKEVLNMMQVGEAATDEGPSLSYQLPSEVSLASRSDQQMVRILHSDFESLFYYVATPVLSSYVYREAELKNTCDKDLLAGPITVYLDNRFVGRGEIPTVARGQTFVVGFGADPQLRSRRELASRSEGVQGGNRELSFNYRLVIENYKPREMPVRVFDRLPHSGREADIRITTSEMKDPLSTDQLYLRTERPKGILRWDINVPASAIGDKVRILEYGYTLDFDRNFALNTIGIGGRSRSSSDESDEALLPMAAEAAEQEFEMQQRARLAH